jgi:putative SOS response-associated peptidase YedK
LFSSFARRGASQFLYNQGAMVLKDLRWGLIPFKAKDEEIGYRMINARAETLKEKPLFRSSLKRKRCLVLADFFYEWQKILVSTPVNNPKFDDPRCIKPVK